LAAPLLAVAILAALLLTVAPALAWEFVKGPPRESVVPWVFHGKDRPGAEGPRTVKVWLNTGTYSGEEPPVAGPVTVQELPLSDANPHPTVIITTHQIEPAPIEVVGEVKPGENVGACAGLGYSMPKRIKLKRPVKGMVFLDGSFSPPRWIPWPARRPSGGSAA
jgi:hypothetical protein